MDSLPPYLLYEVELHGIINHEIAKLEVARRDVTRKYHEQIAEQEVAFRQRLYQLHLQTSSSQHEVLQRKLSKRRSQILQVKPSKNLKQENSGSLELGLSDRPGWCSLCEVHCNTKKVPNEHILGKKHQSMLKRVKQGSEDKGGSYSNQQRFPSQKQQQEGDIIENLDKQEKQIKEGGIPGKNKQQNSSRSLHSRQPKQPGWCLLCEVDCKTENVLEKHILGKKHQSRLNFLKQGSGEGNSEQLKPQTEHEQQEIDKIGDFDKREKQMKECDITSEKHKISSNSTQITNECPNTDGKELESCGYGSLELEHLVEFKDEGDLGAKSDKDDLKQSAEINEIDEEKDLKKHEQEVPNDKEDAETDQNNKAEKIIIDVKIMGSV